MFTVAGKPVGSEETGWLRVSRGSYMKCVRVRAKASCMGLLVQLYDINGKVKRDGFALSLGVTPLERCQ